MDFLKLTAMSLWLRFHILKKTLLSSLWLRLVRKMLQKQAKRAASEVFGPDL